jgi:hypothetical protein
MKRPIGRQGKRLSRKSASQIFEVFFLYSPPEQIFLSLDIKRRRELGLLTRPRVNRFTLQVEGKGVFRG